MPVLHLVLQIVYLLVCILLAASVLMQEGGRGGLGALGGGNGARESYWGTHRVRSAEHLPVRLTRVSAVLFFLLPFILSRTA